MDFQLGDQNFFPFFLVLGCDLQMTQNVSIFLSLIMLVTDEEALKNVEFAEG